jgi:hypothetical protein
MSFTPLHSAKRYTLGIEELQADLDTWMNKYNNQRPHQGKRCQGRTPMQTFMDNLPLAKDKMWSNYLEAA